MSANRCIRGVYLACPSSNTYAVAVDPKCSKTLEKILRERGEVVFDHGNLLGVRLGEARILYIRPSRLHVTLPIKIDAEKFVEKLFSES